MRGTFISFEGIDGCGKSTQVERLIAALSTNDVEVVRLREPGGTPISEQIRTLLLDPANGAMADECELLLYEASRAQLVREVIEPAMARGAMVVCDRFFDSTFAYQHGGRGLSEGLVRTANELGSCGVAPDVTIVLDLDPQIALARATSGGADRLEAEGIAFQERIRAAYLTLAEREPRRVKVVDATGAPDEVFARVAMVLSGVEDVAGVLGGARA